MSPKSSARSTPRGCTRAIVGSAAVLAVVVATVAGSSVFRGQLAPSVPAVAPIIVDNADTGFSTNEAGLYSNAAYRSSGYGGNSLECGNRVDWRPSWTVPTGYPIGKYDVWVTYPIGYTNVRYVIVEGSKPLPTQSIDQTKYEQPGTITKVINNITWVRIRAAQPFNGGRITVTTVENCSKFVMDAVMFEKVDAPAPQPPACDAACVSRKVDALLSPMNGVVLKSKIDEVVARFKAHNAQQNNGNPERIALDINADNIVTSNDILMLTGNLARFSICGDMKVTTGETCDDGGNIDGDGCSAVCAIGSGFRLGASGEPPVVPNCGDGMLVGSETCDDGNKGGCSATCTAVNAGYACQNNNQATTCVRLCGNGTVDSGEQCDAGTGNSDAPQAGCSVACTLRAGFRVGAQGEPPVVPICGDSMIVGTEVCDGTTFPSTAPQCGASGGQRTCNTCQSISTDGCFSNSIVGPGEECDDGNSTPNDGCTQGRKDAGFSCPATGGACKVLNGDGLIRGTEQCDDRNTQSNDGCSSSMTKESGYSCTGEPSTCVRQVCGNGKIEGSEQCDQGEKAANNTRLHRALVSGDGCSTTCQIENGWLCAYSSSDSKSYCGVSQESNFTAAPIEKGGLKKYFLIQKNNDQVTGFEVSSKGYKTCQQICTLEGKPFHQERSNILAKKDACMALMNAGALSEGDNDASGREVLSSDYKFKEYALLGCFTFIYRSFGQGGYYPYQLNAYTNASSVNPNTPGVTSSLLNNFCACGS